MNYITITLLIITLLLINNGEYKIDNYQCIKIGLANAVSLNIKEATRLVKDTALLSRVINNYIPVKAHGATFKCICPFHKDTNPSMVISDEKGVYHCFSCGAGGDVINFIKEYESCSFALAVQKIILLAGLDVSVEGVGTSANYDPETIKRIQQKTKIEAILKSAAIYYTQRIAKDNQAGPARRHLMSRKIRPEVAFKFQLGYAPPSYGPDSLISNLTAAGYSAQDLVMAGLAIDRKEDAITKSSSSSSSNNFKKATVYDRFRDRLMIPIRDVDGKVVGFGARVLQDGEAYKTNADQAKINPGQLTPGKVDYSKVPKYLNSPETLVFKKSNTLFALDLAKRAISTEKLAILVEGYFDVISLHDVGVENAVGVLGTAITKEHLDTVTRYNKNGVICILMDDDEAGQTAVERCCKQVLMAENIDDNVPKDYDVRIASFRDIVLSSASDNDNAKTAAKIKDAADLCMIVGRENAPNVMKHLVSQAVGWKQWMVERIIIQGGQGRVPLDSKNSIFETIDYLRSDTASLGKVVRELASYISKLPIAADRTVISYFCAELISGDNEALRKQLESDISTLALQIAKSSKLPINSSSMKTNYKPTIGSNNNNNNNNNNNAISSLSKRQLEVTPKVYQPTSQLSTNTSASKDISKIPPLNPLPITATSNAGTSNAATSNDTTRIISQAPSRITNAVQNITFKVSNNTVFSPITSSFDTQIEKANDTDVISLIDFDFELDEATIKDAINMKPKKVYSNDFNNYWKPSASINDKVISYSRIGERARVIDAEASLLMIYLHVPSLRGAIKDGLVNIVKLTQNLVPSESVPFGGLTSKLGEMSMLLNKAVTNDNNDNNNNDDDQINNDLLNRHGWEDKTHAELWNTIITFEVNNNNNDNINSNSNIENILLNTLQDDLKTNRQEDLKTNAKLSSILQGNDIKSLTKLALSFRIKEVLRTITFLQARKNQIQLLNSIGNKKNMTGSDDDTNTNDNDNNDKLRLYEKLTSFLSDTITDDLAQMYQDEIRKEKFSVIDNMSDNIDSKFDDVELLFWETSDDDSDISDISDDNDYDTNSVDSNSDKKLNLKKYEFTFEVGDETAILQDGEYSEDELRLQELYSSGLATQRRASPGVTYGLDDIYEDDYGKEKKKRRKNDNSDLFGTIVDKKSKVDSIITQDSLRRGGRAEKYLLDQERSKKHPLSTPELEKADGWTDEGLEEYEGIKYEENE